LPTKRLYDKISPVERRNNMPRVKKIQSKSKVSRLKSAKKMLKSTVKTVRKITEKKSAARFAKSAVAAKVSVKAAESANKLEKKTIVPKGKKTAGKDTGSVEVQIEVFSQKIKLLSKHLKKHIHDFDSKRGLLIMVGKRRRLLNYIKKNEPAKYEKLIKKLKLKK